MPRRSEPLRNLDDPLVQHRLGLLVGSRLAAVKIKRTVGVRGQIHPSYTVAVQVDFPHDEVAEWLLAEVGGGVLRTKGKYRWSVFGDNAERLLRTLLPRLDRCAEQARLALALRDLGRAVGLGVASTEEVAARHEIFIAVAALNAGVSRSVADLVPPALPPRTSAPRAERFTDPYEINDLVTGYRDGATLRDLAETHGADKGTIRRTLLACDVTLRSPRRFTDPHEINDLVTRYLGGETLAEIAAAYGVVTRTVSVALRDTGITMRTGHDPVITDPADLDSLVTRYNVNGETLASLAADFGCHRTTVAATLRSAGVPIRSTGHRRDPNA